MASTVVRTNAIHLKEGSKVYAGASVGALSAIGSIGGDTTMTHTWEAFEYKNNQGETIKEGMRNQQLNVSMNLQELYSDTINTLGCGMYTLTNVAGTLVSDAEVTIDSGDWSFSTFYKLAYQNYDGSVPTVDTVAGSTDGSLVEDTDYYITKNADGDWGITIIDSTTVTTESQDITYEIDYTPTASKELTAGEAIVSLDPIYLRIESPEDENGKKRYMDIFSSVIQPDVQFMFGDNASDGVEEMTISMQGSIDVDRTAGSQLFKWVDEQAVS